MFVVCTEKEQIIPALHPADPASTSGAETHRTPTAGRREAQRCRSGNRQVPAGGTGRAALSGAEPSAVPSPRSGAGGAAPAPPRPVPTCCQSQPSAQPPPALPTAQGGEQKEAITADLAAQSGGCVTPTYRS